MFKPNVNNLFKLINYFNTFGCSVYMSKNDDERRVRADSILGLRSLDLHIYDTINLYFTDNVNERDIKAYLNMIDE